MDTKKAKQAVDLAIDILGGRGRFTIGNVADEALPVVSYDRLSISDQRYALRSLLKHEALHQCNARLPDETRERALENLPSELWPIFEKLRRTITVGPGGLRQLSVLITIKDLDDALAMMGVLRGIVAIGEQTLIDLRDLLRARGLNSISEIIEGRKGQAA